MSGTLQNAPERFFAEDVLFAAEVAAHLGAVILVNELLQLLDVLVDGEFVQAKHDISLRFRGSSNQRLLDVPRSLAAGQPVWWEDEKVFATHTMER